MRKRSNVLQLGSSQNEMTLRLLDSGDVREYEGRTRDSQLFEQSWTPENCSTLIDA